MVPVPSCSLVLLQHHTSSWPVLPKSLTLLALGCASLIPTLLALLCSSQILSQRACTMPIRGSAVHLGKMKDLEPLLGPALVTILVDRLQQGPAMQARLIVGEKDTVRMCCDDAKQILIGCVRKGWRWRRGLDQQLLLQLDLHKVGKDLLC